MATFFNTLAVLCFIIGTAAADSEPFESAICMTILLIGLSFFFGWIGYRLEQREPKRKTKKTKKYTTRRDNYENNGAIQTGCSKWENELGTF